MADIRSDIFDGIAIEVQSFKLYERQEFSRTTGGVTLAKSFGSALWISDWQTAVMYHNDALDLEARLNALDGSIGTFYGADRRRPYPREHVDGNFDDTAVIAALGEDGKSLGLLDADHLTISRGDYLAFDYGRSRALHQVIEPLNANGLIEVRPHIRPGAAIGAKVSFKRPQGVFRLNPRSVQVSSSGGVFSTVSFSATQALL